MQNIALTNLYSTINKIRNIYILKDIVNKGASILTNKHLIFYFLDFVCENVNKCQDLYEKATDSKFQITDNESSITKEAIRCACIDTFMQLQLLLYKMEGFFTDELLVEMLRIRDSITIELQNDKILKKEPNILLGVLYGHAICIGDIFKKQLSK